MNNTTETVVSTPIVPIDSSMQLGMGFAWMFLGIVGLSGNSLVLYLTVKNTQVMKQYVWISFHIAATDVMILLVLTFWTAPLTMCVCVDTAISGLGRRISSLGHCFWFVDVNLTIIMSMNRFVSVWFPLQYSTIFSELNTKIYIGIVYLISWIINIPVLVRDDCQQYYRPDTRGYGWDANMCSHIINDYLAVDWKLVLFPICLALDIGTFLKLKMRKVAGNNHDEHAKRRKEFKFIFQSLLVITWTLTMLCLFNIVAPSVTGSPWGEFLMGPLGWTSEYCVNGYVMLVCNESNWNAFKEGILKIKPRAKIVSISIQSTNVTKS